MRPYLHTHPLRSLYCIVQQQCPCPFNQTLHYQCPTTCSPQTPCTLHHNQESWEGGNPPPRAGAIVRLLRWYPLQCVLTINDWQQSTCMKKTRAAAKISERAEKVHATRVTQVSICWRGQHQTALPLGDRRAVSVPNHHGKRLISNYVSSVPRQESVARFRNTSVSEMWKGEHTRCSRTTAFVLHRNRSGMGAVSVSVFILSWSRHWQTLTLKRRTCIPKVARRVELLRCMALFTLLRHDSDYSYTVQYRKLCTEWEIALWSW